eukprot:TRINITY_DN767_c0_g2_i1.p1 TRINITY_DN767_c0_g2~~TRINITY_DN767_c0_g2_i1.p1  ORF type:complete len:522 (+),score=135.33 TRINITY_DN767_c0_g2_i1:55-1566(+)
MPMSVARGKGAAGCLDPVRQEGYDDFVGLFQHSADLGAASAELFNRGHEPTTWGLRPDADPRRLDAAAAQSLLSRMPPLETEEVPAPAAAAAAAPEASTPADGIDTQELGAGVKASLFDDGCAELRQRVKWDNFVEEAGHPDDVSDCSGCEWVDVTVPSGTQPWAPKTGSPPAAAAGSCSGSAPLPPKGAVLRDDESSDDEADIAAWLQSRADAKRNAAHPSPSRTRTGGPAAPAEAAPAAPHATSPPKAASPTPAAVAEPAERDEMEPGTAPVPAAKRTSVPVAVSDSPPESPQREPAPAAVGPPRRPKRLWAGSPQTVPIPPGWTIDNVSAKAVPPFGDAPAAEEEDERDTVQRLHGQLIQDPSNRPITDADLYQQDRARAEAVDAREREVLRGGARGGATDRERAALDEDLLRSFNVPSSSVDEAPVEAAFRESRTLRQEERSAGTAQHIYVDFEKASREHQPECTEQWEDDIQPFSLDTDFDYDIPTHKLTPKPRGPYE